MSVRSCAGRIRCRGDRFGPHFFGNAIFFALQPLNAQPAATELVHGVDRGVGLERASALLAPGVATNVMEIGHRQRPSQSLTSAIRQLQEQVAHRHEQQERVGGNRSASEHNRQN